jgi:hypothetical protein
MLLAMLVTDFVHIRRPFHLVRAEVLASGVGWLGDSAVAAYRDGEQFSITVLAPMGPVTLSKRVVVDLDPPILGEDRLVQRMRWQAASARGLFPTMDADLEFSPVGPAVTAVRLSGSYSPPLGTLGREVNRVLLFRLAEASMRSFLSRIAERLDPSPASRAWVGEAAPRAT